jgi:hypothetical protein
VGETPVKVLIVKHFTRTDESFELIRFNAMGFFVNDAIADVNALLQKNGSVENI